MNKSVIKQLGKCIKHCRTNPLSAASCAGVSPLLSWMSAMVPVRSLFISQRMISSCPAATHIASVMAFHSTDYGLQAAKCSGVLPSGVWSNVADFPRLLVMYCGLQRDVCKMVKFLYCKPVLFPGDHFVRLHV